MKKKKNIIVAIVIIILALVVGATFAYFTSNTIFENVFNAGKYKVALIEVFESPDNWVPGETVPKTITARNDGTVPAVVRIKYKEEWKDLEGNDITSQVSPNPAIINFDNQSDWVLYNGYYYYNSVLEPTDTTNSFISGVTLDSNLDSVTCTTDGLSKVCEAQNDAVGAKYKLTFTIETVQYDQYKSVWHIDDEIGELISSPIGQSVNYSTTLNGVTLDDWKVFNADDDYLYIILADYMPNSAVNSSNFHSFELNDTYGVLDSKSNLVYQLNEKSNWNDLITNGNINGTPINLTPSEDIYAIGSPTLELWVDSWNKMYPDQKRYIRYFEYDPIYGDEGWLIGSDEDNMIEFTGFNITDSLYFPHTEIYDNCSGYWLASPAGTNTDGNGVYSVDDSEYVGDGYYTWSGGFEVFSLRPIIRLPRSVFE